MMWSYTNYNELYHYGILGMKWGVRRYQNEDGSYTEAGKRRRNSGSDVTTLTKYDPDKATRMLDSDIRNYNSTSSEIRQTISSAKDVSKATASLAKRGIPSTDTSSMTNQQLQDAINRARLEQQYDELYNTQRAEIQDGADIVGDILTISGGLLMTAASAASLMVSIKKLI